jgi:Putative adhesin
MQDKVINEPTTLAFERGAIRRVQINALSGVVHVVGTDDEPSLEILKIAGRELRVRLDDSGLLEIGYDKDRWLGFGPIGYFLGKGARTRVEFALAVPHDCPIDSHLISGSTMISAIRGRVHMNGVSSDSTLVGLTGDVDVDSVSGSVEAERIRGDLHIKTISGDITAVDVSGSRLGVDTVSGAVALDLTEPIPNVRIDTISGDATTRVPYGSNLDARLSSTSEQVASTFPEVRLAGWPGAKSAEGRVGTGGPVVRVHTVSGHATLLGRDAEYEPTGAVRGENGGAR